MGWYVKAEMHNMGNLPRVELDENFLFSHSFFLFAFILFCSYYFCWIKASYFTVFFTLIMFLFFFDKESTPWQIAARYIYYPLTLLFAHRLLNKCSYTVAGLGDLTWFSHFLRFQEKCFISYIINIDVVITNIDILITIMLLTPRI